MGSLHARGSVAVYTSGFFVLLLAGCAQSGGPPALKSIAVTPANPSVVKGLTQQFKATGTFSDNSTQDLTSIVTWASQTTSVATISTGGLATAVAQGTSVITATDGSIAGQTTMTVTAPPTLQSIAVTPANPSVPKGLTQQFKATGTFSDNSTQDLTSIVTWASQTTSVATISTGGLATAVGQGTSVITATDGSIVGQTTMTVTAPVLTSISIKPANPTIAVSNTVDFTATGVFSDGTTQPLTGVTWTSGTPATASISATGIARGLAAGTSTITAASGGVNGTTTLTVVAAASRFAYVANLNDLTISAYAVNPASGTFTPRKVVFDGGGPVQVIPEPSGRFAYALDGLTQTIKVYNVDSVSGDLKLSSVPAASNGGAIPSEGTIDPTGRYLYVANSLTSGLACDNRVTAFAIDPSTGGLTAITGSPFTAGSCPIGVITDRAGQFLYVVNNSGNTVSGFTINSDGSLTALSTPTFATGTNPALPAIDAQNKFLFVPNETTNNISVFSIGSNGLLTPVTGSPFSTGVGSFPVGVEADPSGKYLYVTNNLDGTVSGLTIGANGAVTGTVPGSPFASGLTTSGPVGVVVDPAGSYVAVVNNGANNISLYSLNSTTGALTPTLMAEARQVPAFINIYVAAAAPTIAAAAVFAGNTASGNDSGYTVTSSTGALTAATGSPFAGATGNGLSATDVSGQFFFAAGSGANPLAAFSVTQSSGVLAPLTGAPFAVGSAAATLSTVLAEPSEQFVYTAVPASGAVAGFSHNIAGNTLTQINSTSFSGFTGLTSLAMDPQGQFLYALGTNFIQPNDIRLTDGTLTKSTSQAAITGSWAAGAVDATGQYFFGLDSAAKQIQVFTITPAAAGATTDGDVTALGAPVSVGGTLPFGIAVDPLDRFVFVTDAGANTVTTFSFNASTGALAQLGSPTSVSSGAGQAAVDPTGTYLYVSVLGNPAATPAVPGSVLAFKIASNGSLTAVSGSPFAAGTGTQGLAIANSIK